VTKSVQQTVGVSPGEVYRFSGCANIPTSQDVFEFKFQVRWYDTSGVILAQKNLKTYTVPTDGVWDCSTRGALVVPPGAIWAEVRMVASSLGLTIYVDDLVFEVE
jgi:hypothetical protein